MKKLSALLLLALVWVSAIADPIDLKRAMQIAQEYMVPGHSMALKKTAKARRASSKTSPYYIISRGEDQGYVIVSGDDALPEVLCYTESGNFDENNIPDFLEWYLNYYGEMAEAAQSVNAPRMETPVVAADRVDIAPLIETHWHQTSPYNDKCPTLKSGGRSVTGCVATAASQVLYYWRKDLTSKTLASVGSYESWSGKSNATQSFAKGTPIKWDLMCTSYNSEPSEYREAVATLLAVVGGGAGLDYAESTAGHNYNCIDVYSNIFGMNGGTENNKDWGEEYNNFSDEAWSTLLYNQLVKSYPVLYSGCNDSGEGHAVVVDGYRASTGYFHFNLGWGGQGDGYFTVARGKSPSWGFNASWQECVTDIHPKSWNVEASILLPAKMYANVTNELTVNIKNNATLPFSGVYLYANTTGTKPSSTTKAKSSDEETVIPVDGSGIVTLSVKPTSEKTLYLFVMDEYRNILAQTSVDPVVADNDIYLKSLAVDGSCDYEEFQGEKYQVIYNTTSSVIADFRNAASSAYEATQRMYFYTYNADNSAFEEVGYKTSKLVMDPMNTAVVEFSLTSTSSCPFESGKYYKGVLLSPVYSSDDIIKLDEGADSIVRFVFKDLDMEVVSFENDVLTLKGHFDNYAFRNSATFAKNSNYKTATVYDLTQCVSVKSVSQSINPNALYYVSDDSEAEGTNIVKAGKCSSLSLTPGYNFTPRTDFTVDKAEITVGDTPAKWYMLTCPFTASVPDGIIAREVTSHTMSGISNKTDDVKTLEAGKTYLLMMSCADNNSLSGENTQVCASPQTNVDASIVGTYTNTTTPEGAMLILYYDEEKQYFMPVNEGTEVEALRGYFYDTTITKAFRAYSSTTLDPSYQILATNIAEAYNILYQYQDIVTEQAYNTYLAKIQEAEYEFSNRAETTLTSASKIKAYAAELLEAGDVYKRQIADVGNSEVDFTASIVNPSFESKTSGWTLGTMEGVTNVGATYDGTKCNNYRAVGLDGTYIFQSLITSADSSSVSIEQEVKDLVPGYYRVTAMLGTDEHSTVTLFAGDSTTTVAGHEFGHLYLTKAVIDEVKVVASEGAQTGSLVIGVKAGRWYKADNFTLTYVASLDPDDPLGIMTVHSDSSTLRGIYTIMGTKVKSHSVPGLYIIDGKKVLIK